MKYQLGMLSKYWTSVTLIEHYLNPYVELIYSWVILGVILGYPGVILGDPVIILGDPVVILGHMLLICWINIHQ